MGLSEEGGARWESRLLGNKNQGHRHGDGWVILRDDDEGREKYMGKEIGGEGKNVYLCGVFGTIPYYI